MWKAKTMSKRTFIICTPTYNLSISKICNSEIRIENVTFISGKKIPYVRKHLGFKDRISVMNAWNQKNIGKKLIEDNVTYAIIKWRRLPDDSIQKPMRLIQEAIWILASSQFSASNRGIVDYFGLPEHGVRYMHKYFLYDLSGKKSRQSFSVASPIKTFELNGEWKRLMRHHLFPEVLRIINRDVSVDGKWRKSIRKAAILSGQSILSTDLPQAFMYNMIAMETLLTQRGDKFPDAIVERLNALFSWLFERRPRYWEQIITRLYKLRCSMVHDGETGDIKTEDLLNADILVENLLANLGLATRIIQSKSSLIELSKKVAAKRYLGISYKPPFRARFSQPASLKSKVERVREKMSWP